MQKPTLSALHSALLTLFLLSGTFSCSSLHRGTFGALSRTHELNQIVDDYFEAYLRLNPLVATSIGDHRFDDQLTIPLTSEHHAKESALVEKALASITTFGCHDLDHQDTLTCKTFVNDLTSTNELLKTDIGRYLPFDQFESFFSDYAEIASGASYVPFNTLADYKNFLKRTEVVPAYIDAMIENMKAGAKMKVTTPQILVDRAIKQLHSLLAPDFRESVFYKPIHNIDKVIPEAERAALKQQYETSIQTLVYPAYQRLEKYVSTEYRKQARKTAGIRAVPGGDKYYLALAKVNTTTSYTPEEIMELGLKEVKRIRTQFEEVKEQSGFTGSMKQYLQSLRKETPKNYPFKTEEEILNAYHTIYSRLMTKVPQRFNLMPKANFEIKEMEKFKAESAAESYQNASADGSRPGIFWVPIPNPKKYQAKEMDSLFLHEAIPGHHFQISIQQELDLPRYRRFNANNAYTEGWALYAESLGKDLGVYTDPLQWIGRLENEMHRAIRLVVDTGIHWFGWSREKAIDYSLDNEPADLHGVTSEIERYMAIPGQALAYKLGELKIQELKKKAKTVMVTNYQEGAFHDAILKDGALPLSVLDENVTEWINQNKNK